MADFLQILSLVIPLHIGLAEIHLEYFQKACKLCTKVRENAFFELRYYFCVLRIDCDARFVL